MLPPRGIVAFVFMFGTLACAQEVSQSLSVSGLPDAPSTASALRDGNPKLSRLARDAYRPLTAEEKLNEWLHRKYAPATFVSAGVDTAYSGATNNARYCCDKGTWGMEYAASLADAETRYFFGKYLFPTLLKQDPRYFPKREGSVFSRAWYAATRVLVTRNNNGDNAFNSSEMLAVAFSRALSNVYYPDRNNSLGGTANRILGSIQGDAGGYLLNEFSPDLKHLLKRQVPGFLRNVQRHMPFAKSPPQE